MATVTAFIRVSTKKVDKANVRFRLRDGRDRQLFYKSNIEVNPSVWDATKQEIKAKVVFDTDKRAEFNGRVAKMKNRILNVYNSCPVKESLTSEMLETEIDKELNPEKYGLKHDKQSFIEIFGRFIEEKKISDVRKNNYRVLNRALLRYELYKGVTGVKGFEVTFDGITASTLRDFEKFLFDEHELSEKYPYIYEAVPESRKPAKRGQNTINDLFGKLRTFYIWANDTGLTTNNPFKKFKIGTCQYGTPIYITIDERNQLYKADFSDRPQLAIQRDIFVFQCLIGCRVGDLFKMTKLNIIKGAIEYIPRKTKEGNPITVRVPLNSLALEIIEKYKEYEGESLFPFISEQRYNDAIKDMFELAEITRTVTILNPTTGLAEHKPINEVASSHMARRCFVGNLYKQVRDPNLVGALSGHKEGSKAFARYREIDEEMKNDLVKLLE